jgi:hypothetical protein
MYSTTVMLIENPYNFFKLGPIEIAMYCLCSIKKSGHTSLYKAIGIIPADNVLVCREKGQLGSSQNRGRQY